MPPPITSRSNSRPPKPASARAGAPRRRSGGVGHVFELSAWRTPRLLGEAHPSDLLRGRRGRRVSSSTPTCRARPRLPGARPALPAARLGRARPRGDLAERARGAAATRSPTPASRRATSRRSASRTSARRPCSGTARTGRPVAPAIVWQDRRTAERCRERPARADPRAHRARARPVLLGDEARVAARREPAAATALAFGTVDSWLVWRLTGGRVHVTDARTPRGRCSFDLETRDWDDELLALFGVDRAAAAARSSRSSERRRRGDAARRDACRSRGIAGDQQAALFGQGCFAPGEAKATYGTGSFVLVARGRATLPRAAARPAARRQRRAERRTRWRARSSSRGAAVQWLRDGLGLIGRRRRERGARAQRRLDRTGSSSSPRSTGLGSPHWDRMRAA